MATLKVERTRSTRTIKLDSLAAKTSKRSLGRVMVEEVQNFTSDVFLQEVGAQYRLPGKPVPSMVVYDKTAAIPLTPAQGERLAKLTPGRDTLTGFRSNVQAFYQGTGDLIPIMRFAWSQLLSKIPRKSGWAQDSVYMWLTDPGDPSRNRKSRDPNDVARWLLSAKDRDARVSILGPTIEYRRPVIYQFGRRQSTKWVRPSHGYTRGGNAVDRWRYTTGRERRVARDLFSRGRGAVLRARPRRGRPPLFEAQVARAIHEIVRNQIRRRFRGIYTTYRFVPSKELPLPIKTDWRPTGRNVHIPMLSIGLKRASRFTPRGRR